MRNWKSWESGCLSENDENVSSAESSPNTTIRVSPRQEAIAICEELRRQGLNAEIDIICKGRAGIENYAKNKGIDGYLYVKEAGVIEVCNLKSGETKVLNKAELLGEKAEMSENSENMEGGNEIS